MNECLPCSQSTQTISLFPNCEPALPCSDGCSVTLDSKCVTYTGETLSKLGLTNPTNVETVLEKFHETINSTVSTIVIKDESFTLGVNDQTIILRGGTVSTVTTRTVSLPAVSSLTPGKVFRVKLVFVPNTIWLFSEPISFGLASPQNNINTLAASSYSFSLGVVQDGSSKFYVLL